MTREEFKEVLREHDAEREQYAEKDTGGGCCGTIMMAIVIFFLLSMMGFCVG